MDETFKMPNWHLEYGRGENVKYLLFAFTELGVAMLSSVLKSQMAIEINRRIMRVFMQMRSSLTHASQYSAEFAAMQFCSFSDMFLFPQGGRVEAGCDAALYSLVDGTPQSFDTAFIFFQKPQFGADCLACDLGMFWRKCH